MADLEFRFSADGAELEKLLSDVSNLKVNFIDLDEVNRALNSSFKNLSSDVARFDDGLASASARTKQLHTDLEYIIGDINKIGFKDFDPTFGVEGDISKVGLKPAIGGHGIKDENDELRKFLGTLDYAIEKTKALPDEPWLSQKRSIDSASSSAEVFLRDLEEINKLHAQYPNMDASSPINPRYDARRDIANTPFMGGANRGFGAVDSVLGGGQPEQIRSWQTLLRGLAEDEDRDEEAIERTNRAMAGSAASGSKATLAIVELSRGEEDFAVTYGTGGLAGALRASINNFSQFAFILSPMAGAIAGIAGALTAALIPALANTSDEAKKVAAELKELMLTAADYERIRIRGRKESLTGEESIDQLRDQQKQLEFGSNNRLDLWKTLRTEVENSAGFATQGPGFVRRFNPFGSPITTNEQADYLTQEDLSQFFDAASRAGSTPGQGVLESFLGARSVAGRGDVSEEGKKFLAETLKQIQEMYAENDISKSRGVDIEKALGTANQNRINELLDAGAATAAKAWNEGLKKAAKLIEKNNEFMSGIVDELDPGAKDAREFAERLKNLKEHIPPNQVEAFSAALKADRRIDLELKNKKDEIDERIEKLSSNPFKSLAGSITGAEELNKRISEAAGGYKDNTQEEIKRLREERKKADEEAKEQRAKANQILQDSLTEQQKRDIYGIVGP